MNTLLSFNIHVKTVSEANASRCEHWGSKKKRKDIQRNAGYMHMLAKVNENNIMASTLLCDAITIRMTRCAKGNRQMDSDNLAGSMKYIRDGIAKALKTDDGDKRLTWVYEQERLKSGDQYVRVEIEVTP